MNICPVCGYNALHEPAYDRFGCASFEICPCCGIEFGYDDARRSHETLREPNGSLRVCRGGATPGSRYPVGTLRDSYGP